MAKICIKFSLLFLLIISCDVNSIEYGVATHYGQGRGNPSLNFKWMKTANFDSFRDEVSWGAVETKRGVFELKGNAIKSFQVSSVARNAGMNPLLILDYGNPLYDNGSQPYSDNGRQSFARYAGWLAGRLNGKVELFEVWNEWNIGAGTYPKVRYGSPTDYTKLAALTYQAIKKANPAAKVLVGALGDDLNGWPWLKEAIKAGLLKNADGLSVHLYNHSMQSAKGGASEILSRLASLQKVLRDGNDGHPFPIYVTETGWPTHIGRANVAENIAAEQAARFLLSVPTIEDLAGVWWYELVDGGDNPLESENRFGLLKTSLDEKPAGCRLRSLLPVIKQSKLSKVLRDAGTEAYLYKGNDGRSLLAIWSGEGYSEGVFDVIITGHFKSVHTFDQPCNDRTSDGLRESSENSIKIRSGSYPTLLLLDGDDDVSGVRQINK